MAIIIGAVLCLFSMAVLLYPFFKAPRAGFRPGSPEDSDKYPQELESVYQAIRTLQLEHQLGRVPDSSYEDQLDAYRIEAAEILRSRAVARTTAKDANRDPGVSAESDEAALEREILLARALIAPDQISAGPAARESSNPETVA